MNALCSSDVVAQIRSETETRRKPGDDVSEDLETKCELRTTHFTPVDEYARASHKPNQQTTQDVEEEGHRSTDRVERKGRTCRLLYAVDVDLSEIIDFLVSTNTD